LKALEEDAEVAAVSHEGTRQLIAASKLLPRTVAAPEWVEFGMASLFETPKGAAWPAVGRPSSTLDDQYSYLAKFKQLAKAKKKELPVDALKSVVTDGYFHQAARAAKDKQKSALIKARTLSWSLTYFLSQ